MSRIYVCPKCEAVLNPERSITLVGACAGQKVLVGFHPDPGNYEIYFPPGASLEPGTSWSFSCPVCQTDLTDDGNDSLCRIEVVEGERRRGVLFSRTAGEEATFVVTEGRVEETHGQHAKRYVPHFVHMKYLLA